MSISTSYNQAGVETRTATSRSQSIAGWTLTGLVSLFLVFDGAMKIVKPQPVVEASLKLGYAESTLAGIGIVLLICTALYLIRRTSILGAVLLTGYLGGAVASNVRAETPAFNLVFPILFGAIIWVGLWLREPRLRRFLI